MSPNANILLALLRSALFGESALNYDFNHLVDSDWMRIYAMASRQGVAALAYDGVTTLPDELQPSRVVKIKWAYNVDCIEQRYATQRTLIEEFARVYDDNGIRILMLKGLGLSSYYPKPNHRPFGDLDCYLCGDYERGNVVAERCGATVKRDFYKHSHISYKGLTVENHQFCVAIRGSKLMKTLERDLEREVKEDSNPQNFADTKMILPTPYFNALFLTKHALGHFLSEGISLRNICDWALFLHKEQNNIDFDKFYAACDVYGFRRFVDAVTAIAVEYLGLPITNNRITTKSQYMDMVLYDTLYNKQQMFNNDKNVWYRRLMLACNLIRNRWRYKEIACKSAFVEVARYTFSFVFEPNPHL